MNPLKIPVTSVVDTTGRLFINALSFIVQLTRFIFSVMLSWRGHHGNGGINRRSVVSQIIFSGIDALPTITILSLALALSVTAQFILLLQPITTEREIVQILTQTVAHELAPLLTAIILIGRSGSAITVDLGNMKYHDEIRGLELLGINIHQFFALPRIIGMLFSQLTLAIYFSVIVIVVGVIFSAFLYSPSNYKYLFILADAMRPYELMIFIIKNMLFGLFIGAIACFHGLRVRHSVTEVPQQTQRAIVNSLIVVFLIDGLMVLAK